MNQISFCLPKNKSFSLIIHLNNNCNFRCSYCIAWKEFSNDNLTTDHITKIISLVDNISKKYSNISINIDITWWEPTLHKDFSLISEKLSNIEKVSLQISTNWLMIWKIKDVFKWINKNTTRFNISFHYFEYKNKLEDFINSINFLKENWYNFLVKFLLPNNNEKLSSFLEIRDYIVKNTNLREDYYKYFLIFNLEWNISESYNKEVIDFYGLSNKNEEQEISLKDEEKQLTVWFENWTNIKYSYEDIKTLWLNNYKWFDCYYISDKWLSFHISPKWELIMWPCTLLDSLRLDLDDINELIEWWDKKVLCSEKKCISWLIFPKYRSKNFNKIKQIEDIVMSNIHKLSNIEITDLKIFLKDKIIIEFKIDIYYISTIFVKLDNSKNYYIKHDGIWCDIKVKDINNIVYNTNDLNQELIKNIKEKIIVISSLELLFKKIL